MRKQNVAYLRVSTEAQTEKYGLDMQKHKILEYCKREGIIIDEWYVDGGYSGSNIDRPEIKRLLENVRMGEVGTVFIYKLDRLSRDTIDTMNIVSKIFPKYGVTLISMSEEIKTDTPINKLMVTIGAAVNQQDRETTRIRMAEGMLQRVKNGYWMGGGRVPWGYYYDRNDGVLHPDEKQAEMVRKAYEMYVDGYSYNRIADILGFGQEQIVRNILKRKSNIGIIVYKGEEYKGRHEPIVSEELFYKAQECMEKRTSNSNISNNYMLTGLCVCGKCGAKMRYQNWGKRIKIICYSQGTYGKKHLVKDPNCRNEKVDSNIIEKEVECRFSKFALKEKSIKKEKSKTQQIKEEIEKTNLKIKRLYSLYGENENENLLEVITEEEKKLKKLKNKLEAAVKTESIESSFDPDKIKRVADIWPSMSNKEKNKALKEFVEKIVIDGKDDIKIFFKL